jgi:deoxyribose-phosphate aldolase
MTMFNGTPIQRDLLAQRLKGIEQEASGMLNDKAVLRKILQCIDLTSLNGNDTYQTINSLCETARSIPDGVAAVCVYPPFVNQARKHLQGLPIRIAAVAGAFPSGQSPLHIKIEEVAWTVAQGADEIDMVISRGKMMEEDYNTVADEIKAIREACGHAHLKVILETGELSGPEMIRKASEIALTAGGHFIKTSTGKIDPAATPEAALIMCDTIKEYYKQTGKRAGFKPAGGIATPEQAVLYYAIVEDVLGPEWLNPAYFRIGASRLVSRLMERLG